MLSLLIFVPSCKLQIFNNKMEKSNCDILPLSDVLDNFYLPPVLVEIAGDVNLSDELVLKDKQKITVLQRTIARFLFGIDEDGKQFRINMSEQAILFVDVFEEFYPKSLSEIQSLNPIYIISKLPFTYESQSFEKYTKFSFKDKTDFQNGSFISLITPQGQTITQSLESLISKCFAFVCYVETSTLQILLNKKIVEPKIVKFRRECNIQVPSGMVTINELRIYDIILTVTESQDCPEEIIYQVFQLDSRINIYANGKNSLPKYVTALGDYHSKDFRNNISEVQFLMHFEIYSAQYYGFLVTQKNCCNKIKSKLMRSKSLYNVEKPKHGHLRERITSIKNHLFVKKKHLSVSDGD